MVLLQKLTGLQLVKKFPAFHGTQRFITALTSVRQLSLSWASPIQSIYPHTTSWRSILILSTHLRLGLPSGLLPSGFPSKTLYTPLSSPILATCPAHVCAIHLVRWFYYVSLILPPLPTHFMCSNIMFQNITHMDKYIYSVGFPWIMDRPVAWNSTWRTNNICKRQISTPRWDSNPQSQQAKGHSHTSQTVQLPGWTIS